MFNAGAIMGTMGLDTSGFTRGMLQAQGMAQLFPGVVTSFMANPLLGFIDIAQRATQAIVGMFTSSAAEADRLGDMAANLGTSVEFLSGMGLVASQAGSGVEAVADAMKMLGRNAADAVMGNNDMAATFARAGIAIRDGMGQVRPASEMLMELSDTLAALPEGGARTQMAMQLLGRSGNDLIATLGQGSAAIREQMQRFDQYGAVVSSQAARSADAWQDMMGEVRIAWKGVLNAFAEPIRDSLTPLLNRTLEWIRTNQPQIQNFASGVAGLVDGITGNISNLLYMLAKAAVLISTIKGAVEGFKIGAVFGPKAAIGGAIVGGAVGFGGSMYALNQADNIARNFTTNNYNANVTINSQGGVTPDMQNAAEELRRQWRNMEAKESSRRATGGL